MSTRATFVPLSSTDDGSDRSVAALAVGFEHALALCDDGSVLSVGANPDGQLGLGDKRDRDAFTDLHLPREIRDDGVRSIHAGADTSAIITRSGRLFTFGNSVRSSWAPGHERELSPCIGIRSSVARPAY
jgi:alpha-tubulin suppressor-like RCC1 family protein